MKSKDVLRLLQVSRVTLMNYVKSGKLKGTKLSNGQYDYNESTVFQLLKKDNRVNVIYARVSTSKQKEDLQRQIDLLISYCKNNNIIYDSVYKDISSGIDLDRKNFSLLVDDVFAYKIKTIYITYRDRLTRLSFKIIENIFKKFGTNIVIIGDSEKNKSNDDELFEELISLMHYFSTKTYSNRKKQKLDIAKKDLNLFK